MAFLIGSLPTLYSENGKFNHQANSYFFYQKAVKPEVDAVRDILNKQKYEDAKGKLLLIAASQHHLNDQLVKALARIKELEYENTELREKLANSNRNKIVPIK